jgi:hypothetical protein
MLSRWQNHIVDEAGNIVPSVSIEVRPAGGASPATIYEDEGGVTEKDNPFTATIGGLAAFCVAGGVYDIYVGGILAWQSVRIGTAQGADVADSAELAAGTAEDAQVPTVAGIKALRQIGSGVFGGALGSVISISAAPHANYRVNVMPLSQSDTIGTISIGAKTVNSFTIFNTGADQSSAFEWELTV